MKSGAFFLIVALVVVAVLCVPLAILWALNVMASEAHWGWQVPYNFATWCAALLLAGVFSGSSVRK